MARGASAWGTKGFSTESVFPTDLRISKEPSNDAIGCCPLSVEGLLQNHQDILPNGNGKGNPERSKKA
jgi:hypothetical protein